MLFLKHVVRKFFSIASVCWLSLLTTPYKAKAQSYTWSEGFLGSQISDLRWFSSLPSAYVNTFVTPAANGWNGISSKVNLRRVSSGSYEVSVSVATTQRVGVVGEMRPYCPSTSGRKYSSYLSNQRPSLISPLKRLGHGAIEVLDKRQDALFKLSLTGEAGTPQ
jgi:hypothetical protein